MKKNQMQNLLIRKKMEKSKGLSIQNRLFDVAWVIFLISQLVSITAWYALNDSLLKVVCYKGAALISCGLCLAVIIINFVKRVYPVKTIICYALFGIICGLSWCFSHDFMLLWIFLLLAGVYEISGRRVISIATFITGIALIITVSLSLVGLTFNGVQILGNWERVRYFLGYNWTTNSVTLLFFFTLMYIYLRKSKMKIWEYIIIELANVFLYIKTDTKLPFFLLTAVLVFFAVQGLFKNHWRFLGRLNILYLLVPILICIATMLIYFALDKESGIWTQLDAFLNNRLNYGNIGTETYGISAFGKEITWSGLAVDWTGNDYLYVDCSYIKVMLEWGWVFLVAVIAIYTRLIYRAEKVKDYWVVIIAVVVLIHSFTEPRIMDLTFNVIPVLAFARLGENPVEYKRGFLREIFGGKE